VLTSHPSPLTPGERIPHYPFSRGKDGPRAGLDVLEKKKSVASVGNQI
jgi:hypothetical protein